MNRKYSRVFPDLYLVDAPKVLRLIALNAGALNIRCD